MWKKYYGAVMEFSRDAYVNFPTIVKYIDLENEKVIVQKHQTVDPQYPQPYWMLPLSSLPFNRYFFYKEGGETSEYEEISLNTYKEKNGST